MLVALILMLAVVLGSGSPATADEPDQVFDLPAGLACDFHLLLEVFGGNQVMKEFTDENGNPVRMLSAGKGSLLVFTNLDTGNTLSLTTGGSVSHTTLNPDGSQTVTGTGHTGLILFPTDVPAGPSTTQYQGRIVYTIDPDGVFTLQEVDARETDICAALS
jgi:hypothetical protein